jgi:hypothetical protein
MNGAREAMGPSVLQAALGALVVVGLLGGGWYLRQRQRQQEHIRAAGAQLTLDSEKGPVADVVRRSTTPRLWYRVMLEDVPLGYAQALECDWVDAAGRVAHHSAWSTRSIDHTPWPTHCQCVLPTNATTGGWTVRMRLGPRELSATPFQVAE